MCTAERNHPFAPLSHRALQAALVTNVVSLSAGKAVGLRLLGRRLQRDGGSRTM